MSGVGLRGSDIRKWIVIILLPNFRRRKDVSQERSPREGSGRGRKKGHKPSTLWLEYPVLFFFLLFFSETVSALRLFYVPMGIPAIPKSIIQSLETSYPKPALSHFCPFSLYVILPIMAPSTAFFWWEKYRQVYY
jgi:hypothetical protein